MRVQLHLIIRYTLLLLLVSILAGIALELIGKLVGGNASDHVWGRFDSELTARLLSTIIVCFAVYWRLWRKHRNGYFANGAIVAALTGVLGVVCSLRDVELPPMISVVGIEGLSRDSAPLDLEMDVLHRVLRRIRER